MDKTNNKVEEIVEEKCREFAANYGRLMADREIGWIRKNLTSSYEQGQKDILKLANDLTEKPDRAVRYVPLDKLIEAWQSENN